MQTNRAILAKVNERLATYDQMKPDDPSLLEMESKTILEAIMAILMVPDIQKYFSSNEDILERYEEALQTSGNSTKTIILKRHPKERYMNNYNPELIFAWDGNLDIQVCLDFFQIVSYITDYYSKDDSGTIEYLKKARPNMADKPMAKQFREMAGVFLTNRRMGQAETIYRIIANMHLSESNVKCVFVQTGLPESRYIHARKEI